MAEGVLWLPEDSIVRSTADGFVKALAVPSGTYVTPGTLLVEIEEPEFVSEIRVFRSRVDATTCVSNPRGSATVCKPISPGRHSASSKRPWLAPKRGPPSSLSAAPRGVFVVPRPAICRAGSFGAAR